MNKEEIIKRIDEGLQILKQEPSFMFNLEEIEAIKLLKKDSTDWCYRSIDVRNAVKVALNYIEKLQKELEEKTTILMAGADKVKQLEKENQELKEENEKINKVADKMYEYISYYGWEDFESNTGCNREEMVDYFYKE